MNLLRIALGTDRKRATPSELTGVLILVSMIVGTILRFILLDRESLWIDEAYQIHVAHLAPLEIVQYLSLFDHHPPLHFFILHYWMALFGDGETSTRSLSAIFGCLHLLVFARLASTMFNARIAFWAVGLMAVSEFEIFYSQEVRMYALFALLSTISCLYFWSSFQNRRTYSSVMYVIASLLMVASSITGVCVLLTQGLFVLLCDWWDGRRDRLLSFIKQQVAILVVLLPWLLITLRQAREMAVQFSVPAAGPMEIPRTYFNFADSSYLKFALISVLVAFVFSAYFKSLGDTHEVKPRRIMNLTRVLMESRALLFALLILTVPVFAAYVVAKVGHTFYRTRANISAVPGLLLLVAFCLDRVRRSTVRVAIFAVLILVSLENLERNFYHHKHKTDFRASIGFVEDHAAPGDLVVYSAGFNYLNACSYYCKRKDLTPIPFPLDDVDIRGSRVPNDADLTALRSLAATHRNVWAIFNQSQKERDIVDAIAASHPKQQLQSFFQVDVIHFTDASDGVR